MKNSTKLIGVLTHLFIHIKTDQKETQMTTAT